MNSGPQLSFAMQRMVCFALLFGMVMFTIAVAVMLQVNDGLGLLQPPLLDVDSSRYDVMRRTRSANRSASQSTNVRAK